MSITGPAEGPPCKVGVAMTDVVTGLYAAISILAIPPVGLVISSYLTPGG